MQSNGLAEKFVQIVKNLLYKAKEEGKDLFKSLMIYHNTPLTSSLQSPMQILQSRSVRSQLSMSNAARKQLDLDAKQLRNKCKNENLPSYDLHLGQDVMFQNSTSKWWFPATIISLCLQPRSYKITTREGITYRMTRGHLKPYQPQPKKSEDEHCPSQATDMWTVKSNCQKLKYENKQGQSYSRLKRDIKTPVKLDL